MKLVQCNEYVVSIVATDALVLKHQGISSHSADIASMCYQLVMGEFYCGIIMEFWKPWCEYYNSSTKVIDIKILGSRSNERHFEDDTFKSIFLNENCCILIEISLTLVPRDLID